MAWRGLLRLRRGARDALTFAAAAAGAATAAGMLAPQLHWQQQQQQSVWRVQPVAVAWSEPADSSSAGKGSGSSSVFMYPELEEGKKRRVIAAQQLRDFNANIQRSLLQLQKGECVDVWVCGCVIVSQANVNHTRIRSAYALAR